MARPKSVDKLLRGLVGILQGFIGGNDGGRRGLPPTTRLPWNISQSGRSRAERPTRDTDTFSFVQDVLANMPAANAALWQLAEDAMISENGSPVAFGINVKVDPIDDNVDNDDLRKLKQDWQNIFDAYVLRTQIGYNAKHYAFKYAAAGDCFAEQSVTLDPETGFGRIEQIKELPTWQMRVIWDTLGNLTKYQQHSFANDRSPITWDIPSQIIHWKHRPSDYIRFGQSIFAPLRGRWEQFKLLELDLIVAIHTKAVSPEVHKLGRIGAFDTVSDDQRLEYEQRLRDNPSDIHRFYVIKQGEVEIDFAKTGDTNAIDSLLKAHRDFETRFVEGLGVPANTQGNPFDVGRRATSASLDQKYSRRIVSVRQDFERYLLPSIYLEFALHGIDITKPEKYGARRISISLMWPSAGESATQRSARVESEWTSGLISHRNALQQLGHRDPEGELETIKQEHADGDLPIANDPTLSPNGGQGKGVPVNESDPKAD